MNIFRRYWDVLSLTLSRRHLSKSSLTRQPHTHLLRYFTCEDGKTWETVKQYLLWKIINAWDMYLSRRYWDTHSLATRLIPLEPSIEYQYKNKHISKQRKCLFRRYWDTHSLATRLIPLEPSISMQRESVSFEDIEMHSLDISDATALPHCCVNKTNFTKALIFFLI